MFLMIFLFEEDIDISNSDVGSEDLSDEVKKICRVSHG